VRKTYRILAWTIAVAVAWQAAGIAVALFIVIHDVDEGGVVSSGYDWGGNAGVLMHRIGGTLVIPLASIALLVVSFFARFDGAVKWAVLVFGLVVLQFALVVVAFEVPAVASLHGANALVMFGAAVWAALRVSRVQTAAESGDRVLDAAET
jgi:hypothetical protein